MITYQSGDLLTADVAAVVNTVNCVGVMGKGLALQVKQAYPAVFRSYAAACRRGEVQPGRVLTVPTGNEGNPRYIINFPTKRHWRDHSQLADIEAGLVVLVAEVRRLGLGSIAVPALGCGNGGLEWAVVRPLIEAAFSQLPQVQVVVYPPQAVAKAAPVSSPHPELTRARAILLRLLAEYSRAGYSLTRLEVQKLAYFLQAAGEPLRLTYVAHHYGPYAHSLNHVLARLEGHYLQVTPGQGINLLPGAEVAASAVIVSEAEAAARSERVVELISGFETPHGLELLATVHWLASHEQVRNEAEAVAMVQGWSERKARLFTPYQVGVAWRRLVEAGWLPTTTPQMVAA